MIPFLSWIQTVLSPVFMTRWGESSARMILTSCFCVFICETCHQTWEDISPDFVCFGFTHDKKINPYIFFFKILDKKVKQIFFHSAWNMRKNILIFFTWFHTWKNKKNKTFSNFSKKQNNGEKIHTWKNLWGQKHEMMSKLFIGSEVSDKWLRGNVCYDAGF